MSTTIKARSSFTVALLSGNSFVNAAQNKTAKLSRSILSAFSSAVEKVDDIKPIFLAAARGVRATMDKMASRGFLQGLPFAPAPMSYGGVNRDLKMRRRAWRERNARATFA